MDENEIIELDNNTEDTLYDNEFIETTQNENEIIVSKKSKKEAAKELNNKVKLKREKKPCFFKRLSKKGKVIFIISIIFVVLVIAGVCLYLFVFNKPKEEQPSIILKTNNYIYENGILKLLDDNKKVIGKYECTDKDTKKCYVAKLSNEDNFDIETYLDYKGNKVESYSKIYNNRYVFIYDDNTITLYDINTKKTKGSYKLIKEGTNTKDYIVVQKEDGKYGIINILLNKTKTIIDFKYEYLAIYNSDEKFITKENNNYYLIDNNGEKLTVAYPGEIKSFTDDYVIVYNDNSYIIYDYDGNVLSTPIETSIEYIKPFDGYFAVVINKKLYIYTDKMVCLNPEGIKLKNTYYNKTYIFDKENELKNTYEAFTLKVSDGEILVTLSDKSEININTNENALNSNFSYVSYLDGTLLFYEDEEKTTLLGKYNCTNKNKITKDDVSYENCFIAKDESIVNSDSSGYIPIINEKYVFINDTKEGSTTSNIILYNLETSKSEIKYQKVDTGLGSENISKVSVQNNIIYALNTKGSYLAITFASDGPNKIIDSSDSNGNTSNITLLGEYLVVTRGKTKLLFEKNGKKLASTTLDTIVEYKEPLLVAKDSSGKISISNSEGKVVSSGLSKYEIGTNIIVGIKDNKLNIYSFNGDLYNCDFTSNDYKLNGNVITVNNKDYTIDTIDKKCIEQTNVINETNTTEED